jgi:ketosteroid isomerase-like protein
VPRRALTHLEAATEIERIFDAGGSIVQVGYAIGLVRANGARFRSRQIPVLTLHDGQVAHFRSFVDVPVILDAMSKLPELTP